MKIKFIEAKISSLARSLCTGSSKSYIAPPREVRATTRFTACADFCCFGRIELFHGLRAVVSS